jgi:hypothetical protein
MIFESVIKIFDTIFMTFESSIKTFDAAIVMIFDHVCINLDHVAPDKAKFSSTKSQLLFTFAAPDTRGLRLKDMHLLILWSFDKGLWQSTTNS